MTIWNKLNTLLRARTRQSIETLTDANAALIYEQEIMDVEQVLARRREALAAMIASRKWLEKDIHNAQLRIEQRERQVAALSSEQRSEHLLQCAAQEIALAEAHLGRSTRKHSAVCSSITAEEDTIRKSLQELNDHRREQRVLQAQLALNTSCHSRSANVTLAARLEALRNTRGSLVETRDADCDREQAMEEAIRRTTGDPLQEQLADRGMDDHSKHVANVLARLQSLQPLAASTAAAKPGPG